MVVAYTQRLLQTAHENRSILCFGIDPVFEKIPQIQAEDAGKRIVEFYSQIIDALPQGRGVSALKPNYAYFAQYGFDGLRALKEIIEKYKAKYIIILDAKRGDIGASSAAYAREAFEFWGADALTVSPLMGEDSVRPFIDWCPKGKGVYLLCRTSNPGASDFLTKELELLQKPLFLAIAKKAMEWHRDGLGLVVGATDVDELEKVMWEVEDANKAMPLLIPGVGAQGGSAREVGKTLKTVNSAHFGLHRITASSSIAYAYQKKNTTDYVGAALSEIEGLNREIGFEI